MKRIYFKETFSRILPLAALMLLFVVAGCESKVDCPYCNGDKKVDAFKEKVECKNCDEDGKVTEEEAEKIKKRMERANELMKKMK